MLWPPLEIGFLYNNYYVMRGEGQGPILMKGKGGVLYVSLIVPRVKSVTSYGIQGFIFPYWSYFQSPIPM